MIDDVVLAVSFWRCRSGGVGLVLPMDRRSAMNWQFGAV